MKLKITTHDIRKRIYELKIHNLSLRILEIVNVFEDNKLLFKIYCSNYGFENRNVASTTIFRGKSTKNGLTNENIKKAEGKQGTTKKKLEKLIFKNDKRKLNYL